jgi:hypothetical protein
MLRDEKETLRKFLNTQYVKMKRMAAVGSMVLLAVNLAFTVFPYVQHRFDEYLFGFVPSTYLVITLLFFVIILLIWLGAHVYVRVFEMYRTESVADMMYSPYSIYAMSPKDEIYLRDVNLPMMEAMEKILPEGKQKKDLEQEIQKIKNWCEKGFIPKEDFPQHLKKYYLTEKQQRL